MRFVPAFTVLEEFDGAVKIGDGLARHADGERPEPDSASIKILNENDLKRAYDEGYEAGYQVATSEFEAVLSEHDEEARRRLAAAEQDFQEQCGARLATELTAAIQEIRENLTRDAASCVLPFIDTSLRDMAVNDLAERVLEVAGDAGHAELRVRGPSTLVAALQERLPDGWLVKAITDECEPELTVQIDSSLLRTQISKWVKRVQEASA